MSVAIIERHLFRGTCVNTGCKPTETLVASAHAAHLARRCAEFGVLLDSAMRIDTKRVKAGADKATLDMDAKGHIKVDDRLVTSVSGIAMVGDCNGTVPSPTLLK